MRADRPYRCLGHLLSWYWPLTRQMNDDGMGWVTVDGRSRWVARPNLFCFACGHRVPDKFKCTNVLINLLALHSVDLSAVCCVAVYGRHFSRWSHVHL